MQVVIQDTENVALVTDTVKFGKLLAFQVAVFSASYTFVYSRTVISVFNYIHSTETKSDIQRSYIIFFCFFKESNPSPMQSCSIHILISNLFKLKICHYQKNPPFYLCNILIGLKRLSIEKLQPTSATVIWGSSQYVGRI